MGTGSKNLYSKGILAKKSQEGEEEGLHKVSKTESSPPEYRSEENLGYPIGSRDQDKWIRPKDRKTGAYPAFPRLHPLYGGETDRVPEGPRGSKARRRSNYLEKRAKALSNKNFTEGTCYELRFGSYDGQLLKIISQENIYELSLYKINLKGDDYTIHRLNFIHGLLPSLKILEQLGTVFKQKTFTSHEDLVKYIEKWRKWFTHNETTRIYQSIAALRVKP